MELNKSIFFEKHNVTTTNLEAYLGEATLNKLRAGELSFEDEPAVVEPPKPETKKPEPRKKKE